MYELLTAALPLDFAKSTEGFSEARTMGIMYQVRAVNSSVAFSSQEGTKTALTKHGTVSIGLPVVSCAVLQLCAHDGWRCQVCAENKRPPIRLEGVPTAEQWDAPQQLLQFYGLKVRKHGALIHLTFVWIGT